MLWSLFLRKKLSIFFGTGVCGCGGHSPMITLIHDLLEAVMASKILKTAKMDHIPKTFGVDHHSPLQTAWKYHFMYCPKV